ncbi:uncharacterized protein LOC135097967 isoform X1 [Scylla paramamosain]|uniref:uncharacterized protein LOC135097967 isoform X1 n=1 Tax=Scylla paramamosain TaxID=85552 RepID=UPI0030835E77
MNATVYVTGRGASEVTKTGMYVDSQDRLYQFHTYAGMHNVSPLRAARCSLLMVLALTHTRSRPRCWWGVLSVPSRTSLMSKSGASLQPKGRPRLAQVSAGYLLSCTKGNTLSPTSWRRQAGQPCLPPMLVTRLLSLKMLSSKFPIEVTRDTVGTLKGYLHPPHDGTYSLSVQVGERMLVMLAANGDSDSEFEVMQWQEFELKKGTPAYLEIRFQTRATTDFTLAMKDFHTKFTRRSTPRAVNERQRVTLDIIQRWEVQHIEIRGTSPVTGVLYLDRMTSPVIDIADLAQVREQLLDMTEQKCHVYLSGIQTMHYRTFEDKIGLPGMLGTVVGDVEPFCGRKVFRLSRN